MKVWKRPDDVVAGAGIDEQLELMRAVVDGDLTATQFAREWHAAHRRSLNSGEKISAQFENVLNEVFYAIEEYAIDPENKQDTDISDQELISIVRDALASSESLR
ncbi:colicin immunity domain-containing protein [Nocardia macrotermitis]|uniref:Colicin D immunity protein domain-containing protein n=1 Tax=Nocardia macrotermitis TaxID=2585198 RepID=A0A7K0D4P1_9NOCA|nr:colicin immunity domain-containing protein [Nocardia macrotermitis]MQY20699.1 hypothetical protein [Nocardia macrotermitis]